MNRKNKPGTYQSLKKKHDKLKEFYGVSTASWCAPDGMYFCYGDTLNIKTRKNPLHSITDNLFLVLDDLNNRFKFNTYSKNWTWVLRDLGKNTLGMSTIPFVKGGRGDNFFSLSLELGKIEFFQVLKSLNKKDLNDLVAWRQVDKKKSAIENRDNVTQSLILHEFGHLLTKKKHLQILQSYRRKYNYKWWFKNVSPYGYTNNYEMASEIFSKVTDKNYKWGALPKELEALALDMLNCSHTLKMKYI